MDRRAAQAEAVRRWGSDALALDRPGICRVGVPLGDMLLIYGMGETWEEAFADADQIKNRKCRSVGDTMVAHAKWKPHHLLTGGARPWCYFVRVDDRVVYTPDGFMWFSTDNRPVDRPAPIIQYFGGPKDGAVEAKS